MKYVQPVLSFIALCAFLLTPATLTADQVTLPAGTVVNVRLMDSISSDQTQPGQSYRGTVEDSVRIGDRIVFPRGAPAYVKVVASREAGHIKGRSEVRLQLDRIDVGHQSYSIASEVLGFRGKSESKETAKHTGIGAAVGGGLGAIFGGGKGAAIGAAAGAGTGFAASAANRGEPIYIGSESLLHFRLPAPVRIP